MLGSTALSVVLVIPVEPPPVAVLPLEVALLDVAPPVAAGVSADGPQAADIRTIAQAATATSISNRIGKLFRVSNLGELIDPPRIVGLAAHGLTEASAMSGRQKKAKR